MLKRVHGYLTTRKPDGVPAEALELEREGCTVIEGVFDRDEITELRDEINGLFDALPPDDRTGGKREAETDDHFRYEMLNRSAACQRAIGHLRILAVIEPLLGEDCHVIANTAWRNPPMPNDPAQAWHIDAGPHVPLPEGTCWPAEIPHPVFAIGAHLFLKDCTTEDGPTGVIPGSHHSGRFPPMDRLMDPELTWNGRGVRRLTARAGDVGLFVSDVWHRRMPTGGADAGRFFLQCHYGRRDIAQRIRPTAAVNHLSDEAIARASTERERKLIGLHPPFFYDG